MVEFDPGEGWREVQAHETLVPMTGRVAWYPEKGEPRYWVREKPVPPLPTEPYTVIRVTWKSNAHGETKHSVVVLDQDGYWGGIGVTTRSAILESRITGFEVLAEHSSRYDEGYAQGRSDAGRARDQVRRETAKSVLKRVIEYDAKTPRAIYLGDLAREFGVEE